MQEQTLGKQGQAYLFLCVMRNRLTVIVLALSVKLDKYLAASGVSWLASYTFSMVQALPREDHCKYRHYLKSLYI